LVVFKTAMLFGLNYNVAEERFWIPYHTKPLRVEELVHKFILAKRKIKENYKKNENEKYFKDYAELHKLLYLRELLIGEGNLVEGTTIVELEKLLEDENSSKIACKAKNLKLAIDQLFPCVFEPAVKIEDFTPKFLKDIHEIVGKGIIANCGSYRKNFACPAQENWVYLLPDKIPTKLDELCQFIRSEVEKSDPDDTSNLVKISATFLTNFLHIHPFSNGNGRVARLAISWLLWLITIVPVPLYANINSRETYLQCLRNSRSVDNPIFMPMDLARFILESIVIMNQNIIYCLDLY
jgi:Fic family protein